MKKGGFLRNVLDTIRSNQANSSGSSSSSGPNSRGEYGGQLKSQHFSLGHVARHGFPEHPTALAFDPVQKIAAIGTKSGALRVFGRPGVDVWAQHKPEYAVTHIRFIVNQGAIITVTADDSVHLWSLRGPNLKVQLATSSTGGTSLSTSPALSPPATSSSGLHQSLHGSTSAAPSTSSTSGVGGSAAVATHHISDSRAQSGEPDYLLGEGSGGSSSPNWDKISRQPEILHTLKFQREHITCLHQTLLSKWLYIGTERGNVHVVNVETFELSGYSIAWNKAIELSRKTHPGSIIHISECPQDSNKLLIGYDTGCIVLWDLKSRNAEGRYYNTENLLWLAWHYEGKQFVAAHGDGSLITWQTRSNTRPSQILFPHAKTSQDDNQAQPPAASFKSSFARALNKELYRPINKVEWKTSKNNEQLYLFSGGLPYDGFDQQTKPSHGQQSNPAAVRSQSTTTASTAKSPPSTGLQAALAGNQQLFAKGCSSASPSNNPSSPTAIASKQPQAQNRQQSQQKMKKSLRSTSLTVMFGKSITVLEMDDTIIDFITICDNSPYENDASDPFAVIVLVANDLIIIDLTSSGYPSYHSPYPSTPLNESPVTCVQYLADCSSDLIPFLYSNSQGVITRGPKKGFSDKEWPIVGGEWGQPLQSYPELVLTGHADGTIKFWDMSGVTFDLISKIKTSRLFEKPEMLPNSTILSYQQATSAMRSNASKRKPNTSTTPGEGNSDLTAPSGAAQTSASTMTAASDQSCSNVSSLEYLGEEEDFFAIEKIEYNASTKHLLVAGAYSQVIQFKLSKKSEQSSQGGTNELTTILVEQNAAQALAQGGSASNNELNQSQLQQQQQQQQLLQTGQHLLLKTKPPTVSPSSSAAATATSTSVAPSRPQSRYRMSGFQAELICLTPMLVSPANVDYASPTTGAGVAYFCQAAPKVTALALQGTHSM